MGGVARSALSQRASDLGACGLSVGERHVGYRCAKDQEQRIRDTLGVAAKSSWILAGVPVAFSSSDANAIVRDLGLKQTVQEHTRRVMRTTQSWIIHLGPTERPREDTLHLTHAGKEFFITLTPMTARPPRNPMVQQFSKPAKPRPAPYNATSQDFPSLPQKKQTQHSRGPHPHSEQRIAHLEDVIHRLIATLIDKGHTVDPKILDSLSQSEPLSRQKPCSEPDSDIDFDSGNEYMGDTHESQPAIPKEMTQPAKKQRQHPPPPTMTWAHATPTPYQHLIWGRVKGDGNCYWRSLGQLTNSEWPTIKAAVLGLGPTLNSEWTSYFKSPAGEYEKQLAAMQPPDAWANEIALALTSKHFRRPVITVTDSTIWMVKVGEVDMRIPLILRLKDKHYDPVRQAPTPAILGSLLMATPADTYHLSLNGGSTVASTLVTWNLSSYEKHRQEIPRLQHGIVALQETGCRSNLQSHFSRVAQQMGQTVIWGAPTPVARDKRKIWRSRRGAVPGVALQCSQALEPIAIAPTTPQGLSLWNQGRIVTASVRMGKQRALVTSIYLPSGDSPEARNARTAALDSLQVELDSHLQIPHFVGGDWNCHPDQNSCAANLAYRGWTIPTHIDKEGLPTETTFKGTHSDTCLDYWLLSPAVGEILHQTAAEVPGHRHHTVAIQTPKLVSQNAHTSPLPPVRYRCNPKIARCSPVDWPSERHKIKQLLQHQDLEQAWHLWEQSHHRELQSLPRPHLLLAQGHTGR